MSAAPAATSCATCASTASAVVELAAVGERIGREIRDSHPQRQMVTAGARVLEHRSRAAARNRQAAARARRAASARTRARDAGMRHAQALGCDRLPAIEQQVEIDRARRPAAAVDAAELALDVLSSRRGASVGAASVRQ